MALDIQEEIPEDYARLYDSVKHIVWVVRIEGKCEKKGWVETNQSGFAVRKDGVLMTCCHGGWPLWSKLLIEARPLCSGPGYDYRGRVEVLRTDLDMCILRVGAKVGGKGKRGKFIPANLEHVADFGLGNIEIIEKVMAIGHPGPFIGSGMVGTVLYGCTENELFNIDDVRTCENYESSAR